jgi:transposase
MRQGNVRARTVLVEASWNLIRKDPVMRKFYARIAARGMPKRAIVAVARKLAHALWAMARTGECYRVKRAA